MVWFERTKAQFVQRPKCWYRVLVSVIQYREKTHKIRWLPELLNSAPGTISSPPHFDKAVWTVPAGRMKMRRPRRVPLSTQAIEIFDRLRKISMNGVFLFPGVRTEDRPISDNTLNAALRRLGYTKEEATAHGFRATASTLLNESGKWPPDAIERQLAHVESDDVHRASSLTARSATGACNTWDRTRETGRFSRPFLGRSSAGCGHDSPGDRRRLGSRRSRPRRSSANRNHPSTGRHGRAAGPAC